MTTDYVYQDGKSQQMKPAAKYLRRSTVEQPQSLDDQTEAIQRYADQYSFEVLRDYTDDAVSGTSTNGRKAFEQMMADSERPDCPFKYILVYDVKRFSRGDNDEAGHYRYLLGKRGIEVLYVAENFSGDDSDDLVRPVKQWQARQEAKDLSKVTFRGLLTSAVQGFWLGGVPPFGFDLRYQSSDGTSLFIVRFLNDGRKEIHDTAGKITRILPRGERVSISKKDRARLVLSAEDRVELVKLIFDMYTRRGMGLKVIVQDLNGQGISSPRDGNWSRNTGCSWSIGTVRSILKNPVHTGKMVWNRRSSGKFHRVEGGEARERQRVEFEKFRVNGADDWIVVPDAYPAIIDEATFNEAQCLMRERGRKHVAGGAVRYGRAKASPYLLSGVIRCARCGHAYQGYTTHSIKHRKSGEKITTHYYACGGYVTKGNAVCPRYVVHQGQADDYVLGRIGFRVERFLSASGKEILRRLIARECGAEAGTPRREKEEIRVQLSRVNDDIERLVASLTPAIKEIVEPKLVSLANEKKELERRLREKEAMLEENTVNPNELAEQIAESVSGFRELFEQGTLEEKKEFVRAFVDKLVIDPDKGTGTLYIREFPALESIRAGNSSFNVVAGARVEPATLRL